MACGQASNTNSSATTVATARRNSEIDEGKYANPDDFFYEEKVEDIVPQEVYQTPEEQQAALQQQIIDEEAYDSAYSDAL